LFATKADYLRDRLISPPDKIFSTHSVVFLTTATVLSVIAVGLSGYAVYKCRALLTLLTALRQITPAKASIDMETQTHSFDIRETLRKIPPVMAELQSTIDLEFVAIRVILAISILALLHTMGKMLYKCGRRCFESPAAVTTVVLELVGYRHKIRFDLFGLEYEPKDLYITDRPPNFNIRCLALCPWVRYCLLVDWLDFRIFVKAAALSISLPLKVQSLQGLGNQSHTKSPLWAQCQSSTPF
jgi:hypothetical protein